MRAHVLRSRAATWLLRARKCLTSPAATIGGGAYLGPLAGRGNANPGIAILKIAFVARVVRARNDNRHFSIFNCVDEEIESHGVLLNPGLCGVEPGRAVGVRDRLDQRVIGAIAFLVDD